MSKTKSTLVYTQPVSLVFLFKCVQLMLPFTLSSSYLTSSRYEIKRERRQIKTVISYATHTFWFKKGLKRSMK